MASFWFVEEVIFVKVPTRQIGYYFSIRFPATNSKIVSWKMVRHAEKTADSGWIIYEKQN